MTTLYIGIDLGTVATKLVFLEGESGIFQPDSYPSAIAYDRNAPARCNSCNFDDEHLVLEPRRDWEANTSQSFESDQKMVRHLAHLMMIGIERLAVLKPLTIHGVLACPPYFDSTQRRVLTQAWNHMAENAGDRFGACGLFNDAPPIDESVAAGILHWSQRQMPEPVTVIDFGGGCLHAQVLRPHWEAGQFVIDQEAKTIDYGLSTALWDRALADFYCRECRVASNRKRYFEKFFEYDREKLGNRYNDATMSIQPQRTRRPSIAPPVMITPTEWSNATSELIARLRSGLEDFRRTCRDQLNWDASGNTILLVGGGMSIDSAEHEIRAVFTDAPEVVSLSRMAVAEGASLYCLKRQQSRAAMGGLTAAATIRWHEPGAPPPLEFQVPRNQGYADYSPHDGASPSSSGCQVAGEPESNYLGTPELIDSGRSDDTGEPTPRQIRVEVDRTSPPIKDADADSSSSTKLGRPALINPEPIQAAPPTTAPPETGAPPARAVARSEIDVTRSPTIAGDAQVEPEQTSLGRPRLRRRELDKEDLLAELLSRIARFRMATVRQFASSHAEHYGDLAETSMREVEQQVDMLHRQLADLTRDAVVRAKKEVVREIVATLRLASRAATTDRDRLLERLQAMLRSHGIEQVPVRENDRFDPTRHRATDRVPAALPEQHLTIQMVRGSAWRYANEDRPFMFANVVVYTWRGADNG